MRVAVAMALVAAISVTTPAAAQPEQAPLVAQDQAAADAFYIYTLPLLEVARHRDAVIARTGANRWQHNRALADPAFRSVTTPNNDTIYSVAYLDLRNGPAVIDVPAGGGRYLSVHLMDSWSNAIGYAGTRASGGRADTLTVVGPGQAAPAGAAHVVQSPTPWVWAIARVLVTGPDDLPAARKVQDAIGLRAAAPGPRPVAAPADDAGAAALLAGAARLLAETPSPAADRPLRDRFAAAGLTGIATASPAIEAGFAAARARTRAERRPGTIENGWIYPRPNLGDYGTDYAYRASVAVNGLGAMTPVEAMYLRSAAPTPTGLFDGKRLHRLHFAANALPPVDAFWSLSMYERTADGGFYFVANPLRRYAIGDRTPGLTRNADGSLDLWIGHDDPGAARRSNWLPAPAGPFALSLRAYLPRADLREGRWRAPAVEPVDTNVH